MDFLFDTITFDTSININTNLLTAGFITVGISNSSSVSATATDAAGGTLPYTYQWFRSDTFAGPETPVSGQTTLTLSDTNLGMGSSYYYSMHYTDHDGNTVSTARIQLRTQSLAALFTLLKGVLFSIGDDPIFKAMTSQAPDIRADLFIKDNNSIIYMGR